MFWAEMEPLCLGDGAGRPWRSGETGDRAAAQGIKGSTVTTQSAEASRHRWQAWEVPHKRVTLSFLSHMLMGWERHHQLLISQHSTTCGCIHFSDEDTQVQRCRVPT